VTSEKKKKTMKFSIILSILLSLIIIIAILYFTIDANTINYLKSTPIKYEYFFIAAFINIIFWGIWGLRLKILSNAVDPSFNIGLWESTKIVIANLFLANITPSMAGGEPIRIYLLKKKGLNIGGATAAVLGERLLDAIFLLCCIPFAFIIFGRYISNELIQIGLSIAILLFILAIAIFIYSIRYPEKTKKIIYRIANKINKITKKQETSNAVVERISNEVDNFHNSMIFFIKEGKKSFFIAFIITALFWIVGWSIPILLLMGLGISPFILESIAAQVFLIIIAMMPTTPGSAGVSEGGVAALFGVFISPSLIGVYVLLYRLITYHMGLIAGAIFQYRIFKSVASFSMDMISNEEE